MGVIGWSLIGGKVANFHAPNGMPYWLYTMVGLMGVAALPEHARDLGAQLPPPPVADQGGLLPADPRADRRVVAGPRALLPDVHHLRDRGHLLLVPRRDLLRAARAEVSVLLGVGPAALRHAGLGHQPLDGAADGAYARRPDADPLRDAVPVLRHPDPLPDRPPAREDAPDRRAQPAVLAGRDGQDRPDRGRIGPDRGGGLEPVRDPRRLRLRHLVHEPYGARVVGLATPDEDDDEEFI